MTEIGEVFYQDVKEILEDIHSTVNKARQAALDQQKVTFGCFGSDIRAVLPYVYNAMIAKYPNTEITIKQIDYTDIEDKLLSSDIDFCFVYGHSPRTIRSTLLAYSHILDDRLHMSIPKKNPLSEKHCIDMENLRGQSIAIVKSGFSETHDRIRKYIMDREPDIHIINCTENIAENDCVFKTIDCCYLSASLFDWDEPSRTIHPFTFEGRIPIGVIYRRSQAPFLSRQVLPTCRRIILELAKSRGIL